MVENSGKRNKLHAGSVKAGDVFSYLCIVPTGRCTELELSTSVAQTTGHGYIHPKNRCCATDNHAISPNEKNSNNNHVL